MLLMPLRCSLCLQLAEVLLLQFRLEHPQEQLQSPNQHELPVVIPRKKKNANAMAELLRWTLLTHFLLPVTQKQKKRETEGELNQSLA